MHMTICCDWSYTTVGLLWLVIHSCWPAVIGRFLKFLTCESDRVSGYSSISVGGISAVLQPCRPNLSSTDWWYSSLCDNNTCLSLLNCQHKPQLRDQRFKVGRAELQFGSTTADTDNVVFALVLAYYCELNIYNNSAHRHVLWPMTTFVTKCNEGSFLGFAELSLHGPETENYSGFIYDFLPDHNGRSSTKKLSPWSS